MDRNITTTISLKKGMIHINTLEKLSTNNVEIFNDSAHLDKAAKFIKASISHIESIIGGNVRKVNFVLESSKEVAQSITLDKSSIQIVGTAVSKQDIDNLIILVNKKHSKVGGNIISIQPLKFDVHDIMTKSYNSAPIHKKGNKLFMTSSITKISNEAYEYIENLAKLANVYINNIFLLNNIMSHAKLSSGAMNQGAILVNVTDTQVSITINKNSASIASFHIYEYGFKYLLKGIAIKLNCSLAKAREIFAAQASIFNKDKRVINSNGIDADASAFTNIDLENITKQYISKMAVVIQKYISQKKIGNIPIVFSGKTTNISGFENYISSLFKEYPISVYSPLSFIERNEKNHESIGIMNYNEIMDKVLGKQLDTIVHTNPHSIKSLIRKSEKEVKWLVRFKEKILGGQNDWN